MGMPAARIGDMHVCPMFDGPKPHIGGPIIGPCQYNVFTGKMLQARVTDLATCAGPPDVIVKGSMGVFVGGLPAARIGDMTAHGGAIVMGFPTVFIGDTSSGSSSPKTSVEVPPPIGVEKSGAAPEAMANAMIAAAKDGSPFCEQCSKVRNA